MSVSVRDLLKLPSLRQARVVAGASSLDKRVTSISVLESAQPGYLVDDVFEQGECYGSELAITGFLDCIEDVDLQCAAVRRLSEGGEIGLILFYVGVYLPRIDRRLIDLANQLDFVLIQMPRSRDLRYAEVISDVTECLHQERSRSDHLVSDILARMSMLPTHQRTMHAALRMISDSVMASVLLLDESDHLLDHACWPQSLQTQIEKDQPLLIHAAKAGQPPEGFFSDAFVRSFTIVPDTGIPMELLILRQDAMRQEVLDQVLDVVRICAGIWGNGYNNIAIKELIRAILQDDPLRMRRLADIFHIDIADIHEMWILSGDTNRSLELLKRSADALTGFLQTCCSIVFSDTYEDCFLLFSSTSSSRNDAGAAADAILQLVHAADTSITLTRCSNLKNTTEVRSAWLNHVNHLADARRIFPHARFFTSGQLAFAGECRHIIERGEDCIGQYTSVLSGTDAGGTAGIDEETLAAYMLDTDFSIKRTADLIHVHQNTVKYRLKAAENKLGFHPDQMPDNIRLFHAIALRRLLSS